MEDLNPVSGTHVLLESMLQRLRLNTQTNSSLQRQTSSPSVEFNAETEELLSKPAVYQFGCLSNDSKEQDRRSTIWNNNESLGTQPSSHFGGTSTPISNLPVRRIRRHESSAKPKRAPLILGEHNHFTPKRSSDVISWVGVDGMPRLEKNPRFSLEEKNIDVLDTSVPSVLKTELHQMTPDLVAQTLTSSPSVLEEPEVRGQSGTWRWGVGTDTVKKTKTSKKFGEAKRWAQKVKERWRERQRGTVSEQRGNGGRQVWNEEVQSHFSSLSGPVNVTKTTTVRTENPNIYDEPVNTEPDKSSSLSYMSENLFCFSTSNLMDEIFSGTEWAPFLSVNSTTQNQSHESPSGIYQSHQEAWTGQWNHSDTTGSHLNVTQEPMTAQFSHQRSMTNEHSTPQLSNPQSQVSDLSHNQSQDGKDFIPLLDLSYLKSADSSFTSIHGFLTRKREHWTKRRDQFEDAGPQMDHSSSYMASHPSHFCSISPSSTLSPLQNSEDSESSVSMETAVKKRRMENTRRVRFSEEVTILPLSIWPEDDDDNDDDEEEEREGEETADWPEEPYSRHSLPKWIVSLKGKSAKYKF